MVENTHYATGRRKVAIARVWLAQGTGQIRVNGRTLEDFFPRESLRIAIQQPLEVTGSQNRFDIQASVKGGGLTGQAEAVRHGIARALLTVDEKWRSALKKNGLLTRDPRKKERKKYGQKRARKRFQYTKR